MKRKLQTYEEALKIIVALELELKALNTQFDIYVEKKECSFVEIYIAEVTLEEAEKFTVVDITPNLKRLVL